MPNQIKLKIVEETQKKFENSSGIYFTKYTGLNVKQATNLRKKFKESSVEFVITKNTLTKIAAKNAGFDESIIDSLCNGQIGIAYSEDDPTAPAKVIKDFVKENEDCLEVTGLFIDGENFVTATKEGQTIQKNTPINPPDYETHIQLPTHRIE